MKSALFQLGRYSVDVPDTRPKYRLTSTPITQVTDGATKSCSEYFKLGEIARINHSHTVPSMEIALSPHKMS